MPACNFLSTCDRAALLIRSALLLFPIGSRAQLFVDCSGTNPNQYPSINAALQQAATGWFCYLGHRNLHRDCQFTGNGWPESGSAVWTDLHYQRSSYDY